MAHVCVATISAASAFAPPTRRGTTAAGANAARALAAAASANGAT